MGLRNKWETMFRALLLPTREVVTGHCQVKKATSANSDTNMHRGQYRIPNQIPTLEILDWSWLGVQTSNQFLWSISRVGYWIRDLIRDLKRESGTDLLVRRRIFQEMQFLNVLFRYFQLTKVESKSSRTDA